jgi:cell division protein FtsQ
VKKQKKINNRNFLLVFLLFFSTSLISLKTLKKIDIQDIKISGSKLFTQDDLVKNSTLKLPTRLILIKANLIERELKENLSLENILVRRQIFPFGLIVKIKTRNPIAYGEKILNGRKISGFIDKDGIFINKQHVEEKHISGLTLEVYGWKAKFKKILSEIFIAQETYGFQLNKITFSPNGFLTIEEKGLKTILLGFNQNLLSYQLEIINNLKSEFEKIKFSEKIDIIDLTDPNKPKIKVFKP